MPKVEAMHASICLLEQGNTKVLSQVFSPQQTWGKVWFSFANNAVKCNALLEFIRCQMPRGHSPLENAQLFSQEWPSEL